MRNHRITAIILALLLLLGGCGGKGTFETIGRPLAEEEFSIGFRQGDRLSEYVSAALNVLAADGTLAELSRKWFGKDITLLRGDAAALDAFAAEGIPPRKLLVGVDAGAAPMCFKDASGGFTGFDVELIMRIATRLGWTCSFHPIMEADMVAQLASGNVDCVTGGMNTATYSSKLASTPTYLTNEKVLVVISGSGIRNRKGLEGKTLAMTFDPVSDAALSSEEGLRESLGSIKKLDSSADCFETLKTGGCDAVVVDSLALQYYKAN